MRWAIENLNKDDETRLQERVNLLEALKPWLNWDLYQSELKEKEKEKNQAEEGYLLELEEAGVSEEEIERRREEAKKGTGE